MNSTEEFINDYFKQINDNIDCYIFNFNEQYLGTCRTEIISKNLTEYIINEVVFNDNNYYGDRINVRWFLLQKPTLQRMLNIFQEVPKEYLEMFGNSKLVVRLVRDKLMNEVLNFINNS